MGNCTKRQEVIGQTSNPSEVLSATQLDPDSWLLDVPEVYRERNHLSSQTPVFGELPDSISVSDGEVSAGHHGAILSPEHAEGMVGQYEGHLAHDGPDADPQHIAQLGMKHFFSSLVL